MGRCWALSLLWGCAHPNPWEEMQSVWLLVFFCCLSRSANIQGPEEAKGYVGGSLTVTCHYDAGLEKNGKWWSRGVVSGSLRSLLETTGREQEVKSNRVTLRDIQTEHKFTVIMESLRLDDTDTYWCGIERPGADPKVQVTVTVSPAPTTTTSTVATTTTREPTATAPREETTHSPNETTLAFNTTVLPVPKLLSIVSPMLLLTLLVATLLVWRKLKCQTTAASVFRKLNTQNEENICHENLFFHFCTVEPIYANMPPRKSVSASRSPEVAVEYSSMKRPTAGL